MLKFTLTRVILQLPKICPTFSAHVLQAKIVSYRHQSFCAGFFVPEIGSAGIRSGNILFITQKVRYGTGARYITFFDWLIKFVKSLDKMHI